MRIYKLVRIYRLTAENKAQAWRRFGNAEENGTLAKLLTMEFVTEDKPKGFWQSLITQIVG